jgi:transposase
MAVSIQNPAKCEVCVVIRFLHPKGKTAAEIHHRLVSVHDEDDMNSQNVEKWCREFEVGRNDVHVEIKSGRPTLLTEEIIQKIDENIRADRCLTIDELHQQCPDVSRTVLHG